MGFKEFLAEIDASDLEWARSIKKDKTRGRQIIQDNPLPKKKVVKVRRIIQDTRTSL